MILVVTIKIKRSLHITHRKCDNHWVLASGAAKLYKLEFFKCEKLHV